MPYMHVIIYFLRGFLILYQQVHGNFAFPRFLEKQTKYIVKASELDTKFDEPILIKVKQLDEIPQLMLVLYFYGYYKIFYFVDLTALDSGVDNIKGII